MKRNAANSRTIRELLDPDKFSIDSYQREYAWKERQIQKLINDLTGKFPAILPRIMICDLGRTGNSVLTGF